MFIGHLDIFSQALPFCLFSKSDLYIPVLEVSFHTLWHSFFTWIMECSVVLKFLMLLKSSLLNTFFVVCTSNVIWKKNPHSEVIMFFCVIYKFSFLSLYVGSLIYPQLILCILWGRVLASSHPKLSQDHLLIRVNRPLFSTDF